MGTLYLVATPIGNLKDITLRALETLKTANLIYAEDTRVARKLLSRYGIGAPVRRYDEHSHTRGFTEIRDMLIQGMAVAVVTDAGTPAIADPGSRLVTAIRTALPAVPIVAVPGPSAITAALSVAGVPAERFTFLGYPPAKKGRNTFFSSLSTITVRPLVIYESPHRLLKTLNALASILGDKALIVVAHELTKVHEEVWSGEVGDAPGRFTGPRGRGEFVLIIP
ncbi:MAG: 16S rRNA (cytidine(1402)-2'-O)-methyltransferase [Candidatus Brennerbacteria bacterium]|nr:16S rRNA (cytidine(1402)-2'-O)-methyltransferase [Candidatus Brennerbacteria bacterium]